MVVLAPVTATGAASQSTATELQTAGPGEGEGAGGAAIWRRPVDPPVAYFTPDWDGREVLL
jgi:hypothetical protein